MRNCRENDFVTAKKRQRTAALQDLADFRRHRTSRSVLECGSPLPLSIFSGAFDWMLLVCLLALVTLPANAALSVPLSDEQPLQMPTVGAHQLHVIAPEVLELELITTKDPDPARPKMWDFADDHGKAHLPAARDFQVNAGSAAVPVLSVGFKRRVLYAPLRERDLRIANCVYLQLAKPVPENVLVEAKNPSGRLWPSNWTFQARSDPARFSPAIHVNQTGYGSELPKTAMIGYYLGSLGELRWAQPPGFSLVEAQSGKEVWTGKCKLRPDKGFTFACYQQVLEADFSEFRAPGEYRLKVPGLGVSYPFRTESAIPAEWARTHALGLYHQRCGMANALPFTRHVHGACHTGPAEVPTPAFEATQRLIAQSSADYTNTSRHTARQLKDTQSSLYPFVRQGRIDVSGGHHDAGDYSKYTINSAGLIHFLMTAVDAFPSVGELDNLGLPESGDGKSDVLQEAKWEADFLAKMQDSDGGFYFLVYPKERRYENNVTPDYGDPQVVWPKNTAATAAAVAALAQCSSSPLFKKQFPDVASRYLQQARKGWDFLMKAIAQYGKDGSYQKLTHYGNEFLHDDEIAWAACELFLATGEGTYHKQLKEWCDPADANTRRWGWLRLCGSYGCAVRSYGLAKVAGKMKANQLDVGFLTKCENELVAAAEDQMRRSEESAYGTSFPSETKRVRSAGWYFSSDAAFDLAVACQLEYPEKNDERPKFMRALLANINYELGCNPVNLSYITGLGWKWQREIVHQYAQNDRRVLPPSGIPVGNIQEGFMWLDFYKRELGTLSFPSDGAPNPYPFYDRWGDSYNLSTEFVVLNQARGLGAAAWLMAQTSLKTQPWGPKAAAIEWHSGSGANCSAEMHSQGIDLNTARIIWEGDGLEPSMARRLIVPCVSEPKWIETEAVLPDGRRIFAVREK